MPLEIVTVPCLQRQLRLSAARRGDGHGGARRRAGRRRRSRRRSPRAAWGLDLILITHHHGDHIDGVERAARGVRRGGRGRRRPTAGGCRGSTGALAGGDRVAIGASEARGYRRARAHARAHRLLLPGRAGAVLGRQPDGDGLRAGVRGHPGADVGEPPRLAALPDETLVYSGHEYAESNAALRAEPSMPRTRRCGTGRSEIAAAAGGGAPDRAGAARPRAGDQPVPASCRPGVHAPGWGWADFAGCPGFRRDPPPQGRVLSRLRAGAGSNHVHRIIFCAFPGQAA